MGFSMLRFVNACLLVIVLALALTGVYGLLWSTAGPPFELHRLSAWALVAILPLKTAISLRSLKRRLPRPGADGWVVAVSLLLAALLLPVVGLGLLWTGRLGPAAYPLRQTAVSWHWMLALALLLPFLIHVIKRWPRPRRADFLSRRAALRLLGLGAASLAGWRLMEALAAEREEADRPRRFTGSRREGAFTGNRFPVTHSREAGPVELPNWRLQVSGLVAEPREYRYGELLELPQVEKIAALDCTLGWYSVQAWQGVSLGSLLALAGRAPGGRPRLGVRLESVTGYGHVFPLKEAEGILLATHVGGEPLEHLHGFPLRAVVPTRRGWFWVKWLRKVEVVTL